MSRPLSNIFLLIVLFVGSMSEAVAQSLTSSEGPANLPPADFTGTQFVDNKGCVYIRTGRKGATSWTPRVSRDRKLVCGFKPSFSGTSAVPLRQKTRHSRTKTDFLSTQLYTGETNLLHLASKENRPFDKGDACSAVLCADNDVKWS